MKGKIALVTGASRGIGRSVALRLAKDGATVVVHYGTNGNAADEVVAEIVQSGGIAFALQADVGSVAGINSFYEALDRELVQRFGEARFDILVNNAGIAPRAGIEETTEEMFDRVFAVNVKGPFFMTQKALPRLRYGGRIINLCSIVVRIAVPEVAAYSSTKGAIEVLTRLLAAHLGPRGITVNAVAPGATDTDMNANWLRKPEGRQSVINSTALGRVGEPADIAAVVAFLASGDSGWVTGQCIEASGGANL